MEEKQAVPTEFDCVIIGAGPGGYVAAIRAAQLGLTVAVVEKEKTGGVCANVGCIPSKALIHQAEIFRSINTIESWGAAVDLAGFDYARVQKKSRAAATKSIAGAAYLLKKNGVTLFQTRGRVAPGGRVVLADGTTLTARNTLIATGSRPRAIPGFEFDEERVLSSTGLLMLTELPNSLLILGAGAIGIEFAHVLNAFGVAVHVVEMLDRILPLEDAEVSDVLHKLLAKRGITIATSTRATGLEKGKADLTVSLENADGSSQSVTVEKVLVAVGRVPNVEDCGLADVGIETDRGHIPVGDYYQTQVSGVFAIGDVIASPQLAHVASKEGEIAVEYMAGHKPEPAIDPNLIPGAVYCEPQVASFGLTEEKAKETGIAYEKAVFPYRGVGKATAIDRSDGLVKIIYAPETHEILGAHLVGAEATELLHEILLGKKAELLPEDIATMIHAHPTLSEAVMEAMRAVEGRAIHS